MPQNNWMQEQARSASCEGGSVPPTPADPGCSADMGRSVRPFRSRRALVAIPGVFLGSR
jgi:hypothetical protein